MISSLFRRLFGSHQSFKDPTELNELVKDVAQRLRVEGMVRAANRLDAICSAAFTTSSEWLGELGLAVRSIQAEENPSRDLRSRLKTIMDAVHDVWPDL